MASSTLTVFAAVVSAAIWSGAALAEEATGTPLLQPPADSATTGSTTVAPPVAGETPAATKRPILPVRRGCEKEVTS